MGSHRWRWKMHRGRSGWSGFTPPSGISICIRLEWPGFQQGDTWWPRSAHILTNVRIRQMRRTKKAKESCRPDFAIACYPGHLWNEEKGFILNPNLPVTSNTPPTFLLQAEDDHVDNVNHSLVYYIALRNAGVPVEMHLYAQGGHAFGLRRTKFPITEWPAL